MAETDRRTVAVALKSADLLYFLCVKCSGQLGVAACSMVNDHRIRPSGRGRIRGWEEEGASRPGFLPPAWLAEPYYGCLYGVPCYSVYVRRYTPRVARRRVRCGKIVENKLVCPRRPLVVSSRNLSLSLPFLIFF